MATETHSFLTPLLTRWLVSHQLGIIKGLHERRATDDALNIVDYVTHLCDPVADRPAVRRVFGGGAGDREIALVSATGEAVERYCLGLYDADSFIWASVAEAPRSACRLDDLCWFLDAQYDEPGFPWRKPEGWWEFAWVRGYSLRTGAEAYVPASLIYLPYRTHPGERETSHQVSSGTACHPVLAQAAYRAILELIERDALTICWESHVPFPPLGGEVTDHAARVISERGLAIRCRSFDLTTDVGIPVVLTLALADYGSPAVAVGVAADLNARSALRRSVEEAVTSWRSAAYVCAQGLASRAQILARMRRMTDFVDHSLYYSHPESLRHFDFLLKSSLPMRDPPEDVGCYEPHVALRECVRRLTLGGHEVVLFDLTQPDVQELGLHVVRAFSPTLVRQTIGLSARHLRNRRIYEVPHKLGYAETALSPNVVAAAMHPSP